MRSSSSSRWPSPFSSASRSTRTCDSLSLRTMARSRATSRWRRSTIAELTAGRSLGRTYIITCLARSANLSVETLSSTHPSVGLSVAMRYVLVFPPRLSWMSLVVCVRGG